MSDLDCKGAEYVRQRMPMIGLGTWEVRSKETIFAVLDAALGAGYRFVDTAQVYGNEEHIGSALKELLPRHGLTREQIFVTSKLAPANQSIQNCRQSVLASLDRLQTDWLDLMLIHWPGTSKLRRDDPRNAQNRAESWAELETLHEECKLRAIGVSNYNIVHLEELLASARVLPAVNQCEYHPHWYQPELVDFCRRKGIHFQAYSSFGSQSNRDDLFRDEKVLAMAAKYNCSVSAFLLGWSLSQGMSVLPRSCNPEHIRANFLDSAKVGSISPEDIEAVKAEKRAKYCWDPEGVS